MRVFYVLLTGQGDGCDYTIGCNKKFKKLAATDREAALKEVEEICSGYSEPGIEKATLVEAASVVECDVAGWQEEWARQRRLDEAAADRAKKEKLFRDLQKELGK